jgi:Zn-dependent protease with chaperone function
MSALEDVVSILAFAVVGFFVFALIQEFGSAALNSLQQNPVGALVIAAVVIFLYSQSRESKE